MSSSRHQTNDMERVPLINTGASSKHKPRVGSGKMKMTASVRDEIQDDSHQPKWKPDPRDKKEKDRGRPRTLIVCFDGTGDQFDSDNSNVVQFLSFLMKNNPKYQLVYYQPGIGTYNDTGFITPLVSQFSKTLDSMFAWNLASHVQDGYHFLMQHYTAGDRISIFGFSRGAYTARALAGMVQRVGLLPTGNERQIPFAWSTYTRDDPKAEEDGKNFKKTFSTNVIIDFVGVWDTVASVGLVNKELPFVRNNTAVRVFRHALALDEHRVKFLPNYYHGGTMDSNAKTAEPASTSESIPIVSTDKAVHQHTGYPQKERDTPTDACEVWFAGCHCDVGGGSVPNDTKHSLARIPLRWMIRECYRMKTGIVFDAKRLKTELGMDVDKLYPEFKPRGERIVFEKHQSATIGVRPAIKGNAIGIFFKAINALVLYPINLLYDILSWPFIRVWYFLTGRPIREAPIRKAWYSLTDRLIRVAPIRKETNTSSQAVVNPPWWYDCENEEDHEFHDALAPIYDQLQINRFWKIMEYIPLRIKEYKASGNEETYIRCNKGLGRKISNNASPANNSTISSTEKAPTGHNAGTYSKHGNIKIHRSVLTRLEASNAHERRKGAVEYTPLARYDNVGQGGWRIHSPDARKQWEWVE